MPGDTSTKNPDVIHCFNTSLYRLASIKTTMHARTSIMNTELLQLEDICLNGTQSQISQPHQSNIELRLRISFRRQKG